LVGFYAESGFERFCLSGLLPIGFSSFGVVDSATALYTESTDMDLAPLCVSAPPFSNPVFVRFGISDHGFDGYRRSIFLGDIVETDESRILNRLPCQHVA
jgi:hypothetical protein